MADQHLEEKEQDQEENKIFGEYSIIDMRTEFPDSFKTKVEAIPEVDESQLAKSVDQKDNEKSKDEKADNEEDDLNSSFEIVHYHEIKLIEYGYLKRETYAQ